MTITEALSKRGTMWWWVASLSVFWGATVVFALLDFVGATWLGIAWPSGPDLFPNATLGLPLAVCQLVAVLLLLASAIRLARGTPGFRGVALGVVVAVGTSAACLVTYAVAAFWYHADVMGRSL